MLGASVGLSSARAFDVLARSCGCGGCVVVSCVLQLDF
jgi:hypothetical protein